MHYSSLSSVIEVMPDYTTLSSEQVIELDRRPPMSGNIEYNSTETFNYIYNCTAQVF